MYGGIQRKKIIYMVAEWASLGIKNNGIKHLLFYVYLNYIFKEKESWFEVYYRKTLNTEISDNTIPSEISFATAKKIWFQVIYFYQYSFKWPVTLSTISTGPAKQKHFNEL